MENSDLDLALWNAVETGRIKEVRHLLDSGGNANLRLGKSLLLLCVELGHWDIARSLFVLKEVQNYQSSCDQNALMYAVEQHSVDVIESLLKAGADPDQLSPYLSLGVKSIGKEVYVSNEKSEVAKQIPLKSALCFAADLCRVDAVIMLIKYGADVNKSDGSGKNALMYAAEKGCVEVVKLLLEAGADRNKSQRKKTALMLAAACGHENIVNLLLDTDTDLQALDLEGKTALMHAAESKSENVVKLLLDRGADINQKGVKSRTALTFAAEKGSVSVVGVLLHGGADINAPDRENKTALMYAAESGSLDVVRIICDSGANMAALAQGGKTALMFAAESGSVDVVKLLLNVDAYVNTNIRYSKTALMYAAERGNVEVVELLLANKADLNACNEYDMTALMFAAEKGYGNVVKQLIEGGAAVNERDSTEKSALIYAAECSSIDIAMLLLHAGANVHFADRNGKSALMYAAENGSEDVVKLLLDSGADANTNNARNKTALMYAAEKGSETVAALLLHAGANVHSADKNGKTALTYAAGKGSVNVLKLLLASGADGMVKELDSKTALMCASESGCADAVKLLLDIYADVNGKNVSGKVALMYAAENGSEDVVMMLLHAGANVHFEDENGKTALMYAAGKGFVNVAKLLLDSGAAVNAKDFKDITVLCYAMENGSIDFVNLLLDRGASVSWPQLFYAAGLGRSNIVKILLDRGASANECDGMGKTTLMNAAESGSVDVVRLLLESGADRNVKDYKRKTALMYAAESGSIDVVQLLLDGDTEITARDSSGQGLCSFAAGQEIILLFVSRGAYHSVIDGVPTVSPIFTDKLYRKVKEAICNVDFLSSIPLELNSYDVWNQVVQVSDIKGIEDVVHKMVLQHPELANVRDAKGRMAVDLATPSIKFTINSVTLWFGKYRPATGKPEHTSATCFVFKAMDESGEEPRPVALKLMRVKSQFVRETEMRKYGFDGDCVMSQTEYYPSRALEESDPDIVEVSSADESKGILSKAQAERLYCVVMPLAERNMFVAMKQERFAGKEDVSEVVTIFNQLVKCVAHMHSKGVLHGDIKPMNLVRLGGKWMLIDLDACCVLGQDNVGFKSSSAYVPPEAVHADAAAGVICVKSETLCNQYGITPLLAGESFDVWSLGCILYQLCSVGVVPLFAANQDDNLNTDINDSENSLWSLCSWDDKLKEKKLLSVANLKARNLLSLMLQKNPQKRPSLSRVLGHPFLSGSDSNAGRLAGEAAEFDVFLSYRVWSDLKHAEKLYSALSAAGLRVWWDKVCLESGKEWQSGFCRGLASSTAFVCILSEAGTDVPFQALKVESGCDNVLLEHRLALELKQIDYVKYVFPIMVGGASEYRSSRHELRSHVAAVEDAVSGYMNELGLGTPFKQRPSVFEIESEIRQCQGYFVDDGDDEHTIDKAVQGILKALKYQSASDDASALQPSKSVKSLRSEVQANKPQGYVSLEEVESIRLGYESQLEEKEKKWEAECAKERTDKMYAIAERDRLLKLLEDLQNK